MPDTNWTETAQYVPSLENIRLLHRANQDAIISTLIDNADISDETRLTIQDRAVRLINDIRAGGKPGLMESFLAEYGLSTNEGIALMCLAEALLRVPDPGTMDALIEDKITPYEWDDHFGKSQSNLVNASTVALMLTGRVLDHDNSASVMGLLNRMVKRLGEPVIRIAVKQAMREMGDQFVLGQTIDEAIKRGQSEMERGYLYSYDMLGEAALTARYADRYFESYADAIRKIGKKNKAGNIADAPGISVKLSALHPRFEFAKLDRLMDELVPRLRDLALLAKENGLGLNVDAEEANRLEPTLCVVAAAIADDRLAGWDGFGLVIQAYGRRAAAVIDWLYDLAENLDRKVMVRLVKGAYWDTEVKQSQVEGVVDFPVFVKRSATDISYICCAKKLLGMTDRIYPQFATHNAHTAAAIIELAKDETHFEFQRLHGMGESLHNLLLDAEGRRCRIYAPVGPHKDLLAYLVRRLLENGANSSFVNQIVDPNMTAEAIATDPFERYETTRNRSQTSLLNPTQLFGIARPNSKGWDLTDAIDVSEYNNARAPYETWQWSVEPIFQGESNSEEVVTLINPSRTEDTVGTVRLASEDDVGVALEAARTWDETDARTRARILFAAADLYESNSGELFAALAREAGKTPLDAVAEIREAVDFLRYYANRAVEIETLEPAGVFTCISPWNFPLAIFTGQIAAALSVGNSVLAKPAETTPIIASIGVKLLHEAGVPRDVLQFLPGEGKTVGRLLTATPKINGACFTGSTATAHAINRAIADHAAPSTTLIAETGGLNAAIVDSTALPEQAVRHTISSAFQSAGQRCSAMRALFIQEDIYDGFLEMLFGAMDELQVGDPWRFDTDLGPVITEKACQYIQDYINAAKEAGRLLKQLDVPTGGHYVGPAVIKLSSIEEMEREVFGPVLHVIPYKADDYDKVLEDINSTGYGLTFGLHTRIDERVDEISEKLKVGNIYINRNQIGAIVGSQPFGGEGLSGTGPKAGGPHYVRRFTKPHPPEGVAPSAPTLDRETVQNAINDTLHPVSHILSTELLPGPTGEENKLSVWPRGLVLCLGPTAEDAVAQAGYARRYGCPTLIIAPGSTNYNSLDGVLDRADLEHLEGIEVVALWSDDADKSAARRALAAREGKIIPLVTTDRVREFCIVERHVCIDTTATGGNASLLNSSGS